MATSIQAPSILTLKSNGLQP